MPPLKTEYKYIRFFPMESKGKTEIWSCHNSRHGETLGIVKWYGPWRQYCYFASAQAVYSVGCLEDIKHFIEELKIRRSSANDRR